MIVVSDFLDDGGCESALQYLADYGNELMLVQIWADEDRKPPWHGRSRFDGRRDAARACALHVDDEARRQYTEAFDKFSAGLKEVALRNDGKYAGIPTSMPLEEAIFGTMVKARSIA